MADTDAADEWPDIEFDDDITSDLHVNSVEATPVKSTPQKVKSQKPKQEVDTPIKPKIPISKKSETDVKTEKAPEVLPLAEDLPEIAPEAQVNGVDQEIEEKEASKAAEPEQEAIETQPDVVDHKIPVVEVPSEVEVESQPEVSTELKLNEITTKTAHANGSDSLGVLKLQVFEQNGTTADVSSEAVAELQAQLAQLKQQLHERDVELDELKNNANDSAQAPSAGADEQIQQLKEQLHEVEQERDDTKQQLEDFLSKISSMKTVFRNYKAAQEELEELKEQMSQLAASKDEQEAELVTIKEETTAKEAKVKTLTETVTQLKAEGHDLNSECDRLTQQLTVARRELQLKDDTFQDEKYALENEVSRLTKKINEQKTAYNELELAKEELTMESKNLGLVIEELKGKVESKDAELDQFTKLVEDMTKKSEAAVEELQTEIKNKNSDLEKVSDLLVKAQQEIEKLKQVNDQNTEEISNLQEENKKIAELKEEVHGKQLIIGKLRHEAIILNEHLTKSLSMLKQQLNKTDNTVDRELISNVFLNFLQIPRGDSKKFEALLLISALLDWDEPRKIQAGLSHSYSRGKDEDGRPMRLSFVSLWTDFLEKESSTKTTK